MSARCSYRRHEIESLKIKKPDPEWAIAFEVSKAADAWLNGRAQRQKSGPPKQKTFKRKHQPPIKKSLGELLAAADKVSKQLDTTGWEEWIYDGDLDNVLALV